MRHVDLMRVVSILCILVAPRVWAQPGSQIRSAPETEVGEGPAEDARVHGILFGVDGLPEDGTEVLLVKAQVWVVPDDGKPAPAPKLPAEGLLFFGVIGDASGAPVIKGRSRTKDGGRFEFRAVPGRYGIAVSRPGEKEVALLQSQQQERPLVFDLAAEKDIDLGSASRKKQ